MSVDAAMLADALVIESDLRVAAVHHAARADAIGRRLLLARAHRRRLETLADLRAVAAREIRVEQIDETVAKAVLVGAVHLVFRVWCQSVPARRRRAQPIFLKNIVERRRSRARRVKQFRPLSSAFQIFRTAGIW